MATGTTRAPDVRAAVLLHVFLASPPSLSSPSTPLSRTRRPDTEPTTSIRICGALAVRVAAETGGESSPSSAPDPERMRRFGQPHPHLVVLTGTAAVALQSQGRCRAPLPHESIG
uniref:Uncharacterized protein n=1 Tax=Leersia perrieri TaxID=77586 RepID=A0A0D9WIS3_9ORYZ